MDSNQKTKHGTVARLNSVFKSLSDTKSKSRPVPISNSTTTSPSSSSAIPIPSHGLSSSPPFPQSPPTHSPIASPNLGRNLHPPVNTPNISSREDLVESLSERFVVCERDRSKGWENPDINLQLISECEELSGYKLYAVEEWIFDPAKMLWTLVEFTGKEEDKIYVNVLRPSLNMSPSQIKYLHSVFLKPCIEGVVAKETSLGTILAKDPLQSTKLTLIPISDGDYEKHYPNIIHQLTLKRLGCEIESNIYSMYNIPSNVPIIKARQQLLEEVQTLLLHFHMLPYTSQIDGVFSNVTMGSIMKFQSQEKLPVTGCLNVETYKCLQEQVNNVKNKLEKLGYKCPDPIKNATSFSEIVKQFQKTQMLFPDGRIGKTTRNEIDRVYELNEKTPTMRKISSHESLTSLEKKKAESRFSEFSKKRPDLEAMLVKRLSTLTSENKEGKVKKKSVFKSSENIGAFKLFNRTFVSCEREKCISWASEVGLTVVSECEEISGYKVTIVEDWIFDPSLNRRCIIEKTGIPSDKVLVAVVRPTKKSGMSLAQEKLVKSYFLPTSERFYSEDTPYGTILLFHSEESETSELIPILDGNFDKHIDDIKLYFTLRRLGCGFYPAFLEDQNKYLSLMDHKLRALYGVSPTISLVVATETLVKQVKAALVHLSMLPLDTEITPLFDNAMMEAIKTFQTQNNLRSTGLLSGNTYQALSEKLMVVRLNYEELGYQVPEDPFREWEPLNKAMKASEKYKVYNNSSNSNSGSKPRSPDPIERQELQHSKQRESHLREKLRERIVELERTVESQQEMYHHLSEEYDALEDSYAKLKEETQEAQAKLQLYKIQIGETKKSLTRLNHEYSHTNELIREHNETIRNYNTKIARLEETVQVIQQRNRRNILSVIFSTLLTWVLSVVAIVILFVTSTIDFVKKRSGGTTDRSITKQTKRFLLKQKHFLEDMQIIDRPDIELREVEEEKKDN